MALLPGCADNAATHLNPGRQVVQPDGLESKPSGEPAPDEPAAAEDGEVSKEQPANSQTGSPGAAQCFEAAECAFPEGAQTLGAVELTAARCMHLSYQGLPVCECRLRVTPELADVGAEAREPYETTAYPGNRQGGCSEYSRAPGCLYCADEFPGCNIDDAQSCDVVCADMAARADADARKSIDVRARLLRCTPDTYLCQVVTRIDGRCYAGPPDRLEPPELDCNLSDDELVSRLNEPGQTPCAAPSVVACDEPSDCSRGLTCFQGACRPCSIGCGADDGACVGEVACGGGEQCVAGVCVLDANADCSSFVDCPANNSCVVSGVSPAGRGNELTRSFCQANNN